MPSEATNLSSGAYTGLLLRTRFATTATRMLRKRTWPTSRSSLMKFAVACTSIDDGATGITIDCVRASKILQQQARRPGRCVDDELARLARYHAPAIGEPCPADAGREVGAVDLARVAAALREPVQAGALRVEVGDRRRDVASREVAGEIRGDRALADAALGVDHQRRVHRHLAASLRLERAGRLR